MPGRYTQVPSPVGVLTLADTEDGTCLSGLWIAGQKHFGDISRSAFVSPSEVPLFANAQRWLTRYFAGEAPSPEEIPLSPKGTPFQQTVWKLLARIPYGQTTTYGSLARQLGHTSPRAVGNAVARNPLAILIPCHRVIGEKGSLTGYAAGLPVKQYLLKLEKILLLNP